MHSRTRVVGIAGGSAGGKTTLARALLCFLEEQSPSRRVELLAGDSFYHADKTRGPSFVSPSSGKEQFNFNHPDAIDVERLLSTIATRSSAGDAPDVLVIEGLMVLQIPAIRDALDVRIFVELEADVRALRRILRDMQGGRHITDPPLIAAYYLESARVGHELYVEPSRVHADLIVRGDADFSRVVPLLAAAILS
jgi:uridine kinase